MSRAKDVLVLLEEESILEGTMIARSPEKEKETIQEVVNALKKIEALGVKFVTAKPWKSLGGKTLNRLPSKYRKDLLNIHTKSGDFMGAIRSAIAMGDTMIGSPNQLKK